MALETAEVFGLRTTISDHSYVDRGNLDSEILRLAKRDGHIALKGESKSGKSWLRQKSFPEAVVVQCRIDHSIEKIYTDILRGLGVTRVLMGEIGRREMSFSASTDFAMGLINKAAAKIGLEARKVDEKSFTEIGGGADDLPFIVEIIKGAGKKIVIEDFHYLNEECREALAQDLKALWDFGVYFIIVGIWRHMNYLTYLNPDLTGRMTEISVSWTKKDLSESLIKGAKALNCEVPPEIVNNLVEDSYGNIGVLQSLALHLFDAFHIERWQEVKRMLSGNAQVDTAGMVFANQLEAVYKNFAERVSNGIRKRKNSTKIYAHAMWTIFELPDEVLLDGAPCDLIFEESHKRESRIQKSNLRSVLRKFDELQVDSHGKGLILTFDEGNDVILVVDRTVLFFRKYRTYPWPWENIAKDEQDGQIEAGFGAQE
jgi:hypothetical protein